MNEEEVNRLVAMAKTSRGFRSEAIKLAVIQAQQEAIYPLLGAGAIHGIGLDPVPKAGSIAYFEQASANRIARERAEED